MSLAPLHKAARLSWSNRLMLAEALLALTAASAAIRLAPFRRVVGWARNVGAGAPPAPSARPPALFQARWAIEKWSARLPWRIVCFQKGLALHLMLRRRGIASTLHYGVAKDAANGLAAHVWVSLDGEILIGGEVAADFTCLATYPEPAAGPAR